MEQSNNPFSLEGKTILVTGASSGIGCATAIECSKMGVRLFFLLSLGRATCCKAFLRWTAVGTQLLLRI